MSQQLLRRAWDALDTFRQAYPENWHDEDQQLMDDLIKADLDLSGVKREWVGLTDEDIALACGFGAYTTGSTRLTLNAVSRTIEAKLKEKNNG